MKKFLSLTLVLSMIFTLLSGMYAEAEEKLIMSESFEGLSGTKLPANWGYLGTFGTEMCSYDTKRASDGKSSALVSDKTSEATAGFVSPYAEVKENSLYTVAVDVFVYEGMGSVFFKFFDANKAQISYKSKRTTKVGEWSLISFKETVPAGTKYITVTCGGTKADTTVAAFDNIRVYEGEVAVTAYKNDAHKITTEKEELLPENLPPIEEGEIYSDGFEGVKGTELPKDWTYFGNLNKDMCSYDTSKFTEGSQSAYVEDKAADLAAGYTSPMIEAKAGYPYSAIVDVYLYEGSASMFLKFYDENKKQLASKTISTSNKGMWNVLSVNNTAPAGTKYVGAVLGGTKAGTTVASYDNFALYSGVKSRAPIKPEKEFDPPVQKDAVTSKLITPNGDKLIYTPYNEQGDSLTDFSYAGFYAGEYELPDTSKLPLAATIEPSKDPNADDTKRIQEVIDKVYNESANDFMKVIKLKAGKYNINSTGLFMRSGIVLSGEGQGPDGTVLYATDKKQYAVITAEGIVPVAVSGNANVTDDYVKAGSDVITIEADKASMFKVGDLIAIYHPSTEEWIKAMEMDAVKDAYNDNKNSWRKDTVDVYTERNIKAIDGNKITLDFPLYAPLIKEYSQSYIYKISDDMKIKNVGIENLRIDSYYNGNFDDEQHASKGITFKNAKDCFVRSCSARHLVFAAVECADYTKRITITNCSMLDPVSQVAGSRRYSFCVSDPSQQILTTNCYSYDSRHDYATTRQVTGPVVYLDSVNDESNDSSEPHGTWTTGLLYDNIFGIGSGNDGIIAMSNRGIYGTDLSQGWTAGNSVVWNVLQTLVISHKPPLTYQNFMIGAWGVYDDEDSYSMKDSNLKRVAGYYRTTYIGKDDDKTPYSYTTPDTFMAGTAHTESPTAPVEPRSLFKAQLAERLTGTIKNVRPNAPVIVSPRAEYTNKDTNVKFKGLYQKGAEKVTIYIDNKPYDAKLDSVTNTFTLDIQLEKGVHKIYATQVIDGVESTKCADRFLTVIESTGNKDYLISDIDYTKTGLILNDPRVTFDVYQAEKIEKTANDIKVIINNELLQSDVKPFETQGRVLVPMRAIFEALDAEVSWDAETFTATAAKENTTVKITENQTVAYVNGAPVTLDVPATIVNGRFVVPVRFISESFGAKVGWIDVKRTVTIDGGKAFYPSKHDIKGAVDVYDAVQSGDDGAGHSINFVLDGFASTNWSIDYKESDPMGAYGIFDLGSEKELTGVMIAFFRGSERAYTFEIYVSDDGVNFTKALDKTISSGTTIELENYPLNAKGRYVKYVSYGNSVNTWSNITEVVITAK